MSFLETEYTSHHDSKRCDSFLRYHRKKQKLSLNYFADMIGITPSFSAMLNMAKGCGVIYKKEKAYCLCLMLLS